MFLVLQAATVTRDISHNYLSQSIHSFDGPDSDHRTIHQPVQHRMAARAKACVNVATGDGAKCPERNPLWSLPVNLLRHRDFVLPCAAGC